MVNIFTEINQRNQDARDDAVEVSGVRVRDFKRPKNLCGTCFCDRCICDD